MNHNRVPSARSNQAVLQSLLQQKNASRTFEEAIKNDPRVAGVNNGVDALKTICWSQISNDYLQIPENDANNEKYKPLRDIMVQIRFANKKAGYWTQMINQYNQALISKGILIGKNMLTMRRNTSNIIDARYIAYMCGDGGWMSMVDEMNEFKAKHGLYAVIPCFETGCMDITDDLSIYWTIDNIQFDEKYVELTVVVVHNEDNINELPAIGTKLRVRVPEDGEFICERFELKISSMESYLSLISPKRIWSSKEDRNIFSKIFLKFAKLIDGLSEYGEVDEFMAECISEFNSYIIAINYLLSMKKVSRPKTARPKEKSDSIAKYSQADQDARKVRTLDMVQFISVKVPRAPSEATVRTYTIASWSVRGHIRHCASGKEVYIKPHTSTRRCIAEAESKTPAPRTIVVDDSTVR